MYKLYEKKVKLFLYKLFFNIIRNGAQVTCSHTGYIEHAE